MSNSAGMLEKSFTFKFDIRPYQIKMECILTFDPRTPGIGPFLTNLVKDHETMLHTKFKQVVKTRNIFEYFSMNFYVFLWFEPGPPEKEPFWTLRTSFG